jgi:acyl-CoA hydrolase
MFSDGIIDLVERGVLTGARKKKQRGKIVAGFCLGTRKLYDFIDDNPSIEMKDIGYVNDTAMIRLNPKVTAINSAIEVDLFGQVCAESIGTRQFSGVGGQLDFIRGASLSEGGKPIIRPGASVTTSRAHVHYVVTEYGIAYLYGKNLRERAEALISVAHPDHRQKLEEAAHALFRR